MPRCPLRFLLRNTVKEMQALVHIAMKYIDGLAIHERTSARDAREAESLGFADRCFRNTSRSQSAMDPHTLYAALCALAHEVNGNVRPRSDHETVDLPGNRLNIRKCGDPFHLRGVRIAGKDFIAQLSKPSKNAVPNMVWVA